MFSAFDWCFSDSGSYGCGNQGPGTDSALDGEYQSYVNAPKSPGIVSHVQPVLSPLLTLISLPSRSHSLTSYLHMLSMDLFEIMLLSKLMVGRRSK